MHLFYRRGRRHPTARPALAIDFASFTAIKREKDRESSILIASISILHRLCDSVEAISWDSGMLWILVRIPVGHVPIRGEAMSNWNSFDVFSKVEIHPVDSPELLSPQTLPASFKIKGFIHNSVNYSSI